MPKLEEIDKEFEEIIQDLPAEILDMAAEFGAIVSVMVYRKMGKRLMIYTLATKKIQRLKLESIFSI